MTTSTPTCDECGSEVPALNQEGTYGETYCLECFEAECNRCGIDISDDESRQKLEDDYFCLECAERICTDCGEYIQDLEERRVFQGTVRCKECTWCYKGHLCCGCGTDISDSIEMVIVNQSHQFCKDCKKDLSEDADIDEYPFQSESADESNQEAPF